MPSHRKTASRRTHESLRQAEERFRTLFEFAPEALVIFDPDTRRFVDVNENACELFGRAREDLLELSPIDVSPPRQPDGSPSDARAMMHVGRALEGRHEVFEWTHQHADGREIPCEVGLVRLPDPDRRLVRGSVRDITEQKRAEAERERLARELIQAQKMQAVGQLTGGIAHDFNNLLTVVTSNLELIDRFATDENRVRELSHHAFEACSRAASLTQRLLAFARRQPLRPQIVDVGALAQSTEELLRRTLGEPIAVELALADGLWPCEVDPAQLENALLNLAINARDAMPGGGRLTIETGNAELDAEFARQHGDVAPGKYVMLAVHDDGQGMAPEVAARAFEPFFTTKGPGQGSGLGLSMVYGFVKQSGGHVTLDSAPGAGTTVRLYLPRVEHADVQPRRDEADHETQADPLGDGQLVLVVEDQPNVRRTVIALLRELGYRTASAGDVPQAVAAIEREPSVALVLSDVVLPGGHSGFDLMQRAQALRPGLPLLLMSGYTQDAMGADGRLRPGVTLLEKPFTQHALARALARALAAASR